MTRRKRCCSTWSVAPGSTGSPACARTAAGPRRVRRPILDLRRTETRAFVAALGLETVTDPSNFEARFRRNRVRHEVLPLLAEVAGRDPVPLMAGPPAYWQRTPISSTFWPAHRPDRRSRPRPGSPAPGQKGSSLLVARRARPGTLPALISGAAEGMGGRDRPGCGLPTYRWPSSEPFFWSPQARAEAE